MPWPSKKSADLRRVLLRHHHPGRSAPAGAGQPMRESSPPDRASHPAGASQRPRDSAPPPNRASANRAARPWRCSTATSSAGLGRSEKEIWSFSPLRPAFFELCSPAGSPGRATSWSAARGSGRTRAHPARRSCRQHRRGDPHVGIRAGHARLTLDVQERADRALLALHRHLREPGRPLQARQLLRRGQLIRRGRRRRGGGGGGVPPCAEPATTAAERIAAIS